MKQDRVPHIFLIKCEVTIISCSVVIKTSYFCLALMFKLEIIRIKVIKEQASKVWHWLNFRHILSDMIEDDT